MTAQTKTIDKANVGENRGCVDYDYSINDQVLITNKDIHRKLYVGINPALTLMCK